MTAAYYACAAQTGREYAVEDELRDLGLWVWVPKLVYAIRPPNTKIFTATHRPRWPGYVFAELDAAAFFEARNVRYLHKTKLQLDYREAASLIRAHDQIEAENARIIREIEMGQRKGDWVEGQRLDVIDGPFAHRLATFAKIIDRTAEKGYWLQAYIDGMALPVELNPADVRAG